MLKKKWIFLTLLLIVAIPMLSFADEKETDAQQETLLTQGKSYDFFLALNGGVINGHFSFAGEFLYAQEFGKGRGLFQMAGFALKNKDLNEYGTSIGIGGTSDKGISFYLFADSLYHQKFFLQLRPVVRVRFDWLALTAWYAYPFSLSKETFQINGKDVVAAKQIGGQIDLVPASWLRIYGNLMLIQNKHNSYRIGAEVRPWKFIALSVNYYKSSPGLYSHWHSYDNVHVGLRFLFGAEQSSFSPTKRRTVPVSYPILITKQEEEDEESKPPETKYVNVEVKYQRVDDVPECPIIHPNDPVYLNHVLLEASFSELEYPDNKMEKIGNGLFLKNVDNAKVNYPLSKYRDTYPYRVYIIDGAFYNNTNDEGQHQRAHLIWLNGKLMEDIKSGWKREYLLVRIDANGVAHEVDK